MTVDGDDSTVTSPQPTATTQPPDTQTRKPSLKTQHGSFHKKTSLNDDTKFQSHKRVLNIKYSILVWLLDYKYFIGQNKDLELHMIFKT